MQRWIKVTLGVGLTAMAAYVIVGEQMAGVSANAVVNAQVITLRAPVDGELSLATRSLGAQLGAGEVVATITDPRADESRLVDLRRALDASESDLRRLEDMATALVAGRAALLDQARDYGAGRLRQLSARLDETRATLEAAQARLREADATLRRSNDLSRTGIQTVAEFNRAKSTFEVATQEVEATRNRLRYLTVEHEAASRGVFLGDSYNDAPSSQQRVRELDLRIGELAAEMRERNRRILLLERQVEEERVRLARHRHAHLSAPATAVLWEVMTGNGEYVRRAQDIMRLVDCGTAVVTASVRESVYNRLKVGDAARVRLLGEDGRVFEGTVARLAGSGAETIYRHLAVGPSDEHLKRYDVAISVPGLAADRSLACTVGRTGRVVFASRPLDPWRHLLATLGFG